jgi:trehalose-6-phosphatase
MTKKKLCFDLDGVICTTFKKRYFTAKPKKKIIKLINELYKKNTIIVFTARFMGRNKENIYKAKKWVTKKLTIS